MNARSAYYCDRHLERIANRIKRYILPWTPSIDGASMVSILKEVYGEVLYGNDEVKYKLIHKYRDKVSPQLLFDEKKLKEKGKRQADDQMRKIVYCENPFLKMISKEPDGFQGKYLPVPIAYVGGQ